MSELSIVLMRMCESNNYWERRLRQYTITLMRHRPDFECTCPAFKYHPEKPCKHIIEVKGEWCGWHEQYSEEKLGNDPAICPKCGGPTVVVKVGV
jgi:hypothetical protein